MRGGVRAVAPVFQLYRFTDEDTVWWRLVSPNGRGIARVPHGLPDPDAARESIAGVVAVVDRLDPLLRLTPEYRWRWELQHAGASVVHGIGDHDRRVRCENAAHRFLQIAADAPTDPVVCTFRRVGPAPRLARRLAR
ncbi:hypothetical protein [Cellulomonas soli]|uniref:hypothetical protein n=1 Tax=Cellulomonas soli TaxID=931535 RepID=UPI0031E4E9A0